MSDQKENLQLHDFVMIFGIATVGLGGSLLVATLVLLGIEGVISEIYPIASLLLGGAIIIVLVRWAEKMEE